MQSCGTGEALVKGDGKDLLIKTKEQNQHNQRKDDGQCNIGPAHGQNTAEHIVIDIRAHAGGEGCSDDADGQGRGGNKRNGGIGFDAADADEQIELYLEQGEEASEEERGYMRKKVKDIAAHEEEIDAMINEHTTGWKTGRMNKVDLSVLRLAVYEMKWDDEVPVKVAINEAVELAKNFSGDEGPAFVNGVLGKLA